MARVVDGGVVQQHQVLIRSSASNVKPAVPFARALDAWKQLNGLQHVDFAHQGREALDGGDGHFSFAQVGALCVLACRANDSRRLHSDRLGRQFHVPLHVAGAVHIFHQGGIANERTRQGRRGFGQGEAVKPVDVGGGALVLAIDNDVGPQDVFTGACVGDPSPDCEGARLRESRHSPKQHEDHDERGVKNRGRLWTADHGVL